MDIAPTGPPMLSRPEDRAALAEAGPGCLFLTGKAGTGKSTLLREFAASSGLQCAILAPTGLAAIQVGGQTIHSFFRLKPGPLPPGSDEIAGFRPYHPRHRLIRAIDVLVIDEISMVRADLFDAIDTALRRTLRSDLPFAGKRLIVVGDLLQLEPVVSRGAESEMLGDLYPSPFFFDSHVFRDTNLSVLELTEVHRQAGDE
ncbi:MAG: AAA family ATPase, partial [Fimbriimonadaceae bacterium]|nr:AAA family ATPase [Fimbriimonadaceae bacterium]